MTIVIDVNDYLAHYGTPRHSGRYPWGSGENPYQNNRNFMGFVKELRAEGMTDAEIAKSIGYSRSRLQAAMAIAKNENRQADILQAQRLKDRGWSNVAIAERMGMPESTIRTLLKPGAMDKAQVLDSTANMIKSRVDEADYIDIGAGSHHQLGISKTKFKQAVAKLEEEGYKKHYVKVQQLSTGHYTSMPVLSRPDVPYSEVYKNRDHIKLITDVYTEDGGRTWANIKPPVSIDSSRVKINYAEDGGAKADGVIYIRPGVEDVSLGKSRYAQVRIGVDDTHFLKGMAMYRNDLPPGVDLVFNTNKTREEAPTKHAAMKPMKKDRYGNIVQDNPFGASITRQQGVMNILSEEGTWDTWSKNLSSQFLSKQSPDLAKTQLDMTFERKQDELNEIMTLTNPVVRRHLLKTFAEGADSDAVHLQAAALPKQASNVLLPVQTLKPNEIYAPNHKNGDRVVLVRHPHGGIFEIPQLVVNNKNREARSTIGTNAPDAVGINPQVAAKLSGADFDGDTVLVIRNNSGQVRTAPSLEGLKDFDPIRAYPGYEGMPVMKPKTKGYQMGDISNLITDMTIKGASQSELARAVRHSMVVIDAEKHGLDYKRSAIDNGIPALKKKYQGGERAGASTLISLAGSETRVPERKQGFKVDPKTGHKIFTETGNTYVDKKTGKTKPVMTKVNKLAEARDAHSLSSGTTIEDVYADHSNRLKGMANATRLEVLNTKTTPRSESARAAYSNEVASLRSKLNLAESNAPLERQAQVVGNKVYQQKLRDEPDMTDDEKKKVKHQVLAEARARTGASKQMVDITPDEWNAIQAGAVSPTMLEDILNNTDLDKVKEYATPRSKPAMTNAKEARARAMAAAGYTQSEIAEQLGVSVSTINKALG